MERIGICEKIKNKFEKIKTPTGISRCELSID